MFKIDKFEIKKVEMFQLAPNMGHEGYWIWKFRENTIISCLDKIRDVIPGGHS